MKIRTNLAQPQITKILKALEGRNLIKSIKSVNNPSRKLYMCYELEPSRELTGGAWYAAKVVMQPMACAYTACVQTGDVPPLQYLHFLLLTGTQPTSLTANLSMSCVKHVTSR